MLIVVKTITMWPKRYRLDTKNSTQSCLFLDDADMVHAARRDSTCSFYQPPPPTDIERIRSNMIKEQKVVGLIREIVGEEPLEPFLSRNWARGCFQMLMRHICLRCSLRWFYVDAAFGGVRSEGPQCLLPDPAHPPEFRQRHFRQYEHSGCV